MSTKYKARIISIITFCTFAFFLYGGHAIVYAVGGADGTYSPDVFRLENPLESVEGKEIDVFGLIIKILDFLIMLAIPVIIFFIIWAGFLFLQAQGKSEKLSAARKNLLNVVIGAAIILGARVILSFLVETISAIANDVK